MITTTSILHVRPAGQPKVEPAKAAVFAVSDNARLLSIIITDPPKWLRTAERKRGILSRTSMRMMLFKDHKGAYTDPATMEHYDVQEQ